MPACHEELPSVALKEEATGSGEQLRAEERRNAGGSEKDRLNHEVAEKSQERV
jgi:hypothetical protein